MLRRSSCVSSHQADDFRIGIRAAQMAPARPSPACAYSSYPFSARSVYARWLVTPATRQEVCDGSSGKAIAGPLVIEIAVTGGSGSPLTGRSAVIRQAPVWPPLKVVNMWHPSLEPDAAQAR